MQKYNLKGENLGDFFINIPNKAVFIKLVKKTIKGKHKKPKLFFYLNTADYYQKRKDHKFIDNFQKAEYCYLNSFYISLILRITLNKHFDKLNAEDFIYEVFSLCQNNKQKVYLLGSDKKSNYLAIKKIKVEYPELTISGDDGYSQKNNLMLKAINLFSPDILIVGLGLGYQENWLANNKDKLKVKMAITVGNFIDVLGTKKSLPPHLFKQIQIEWLYRLIKEPAKMFGRYFFGSREVITLVIKRLFFKFIRFLQQNSP